MVSKKKGSKKTEIDLPFSKNLVYLSITALYSVWLAGITIYTTNREYREQMEAQRIQREHQMKLNENILSFPLKDQHGSGNSGLVRMVEHNGKLEVTVTLVDKIVSTNAATIKAGLCVSPKQELYALTDSENGKSITILDATLSKLLDQKPFVVETMVGKTKIVASCGQIQ